MSSFVPGYPPPMLPTLLNSMKHTPKPCELRNGWSVSKAELSIAYYDGITDIFMLMDQYV